MKCPKCGKELENDVLKCPHCAYSLGETAPIRDMGETFMGSGEDIPADDQRTVPEPEKSFNEEATFEDIKGMWGSLTGSEDIAQTIRESAETIQVPSSISVREQTLGGIEGNEDLPGESPPDYKIIDKIGEGGMGVIYTARQNSIDRIVALKMVKGDMEQRKRDLFLSEAVATGNLDHPNIVPIHDLGSNKQGKLFYSMKKVTGIPWNKAIREKARLENIEILVRVCDAMAFAHSRGVIHRDLKPENVMLGDFGEVYVMDWGLAASVTDEGKAQPLNAKMAAGGTPGYMAPEMGTGDIKKIGERSDVYLLGAILFEIVTGRMPHAGGSIYECLHNITNNLIVETDVKGELIDIAYKAMSTEPDDRYEGVKEFQKAVRDHLSHAESLRLSQEAFKTLRDAGDNYEAYANAIFGLQEAVKIWDGNESARNGLVRARIAYAQCALKRGDLALAESLLDNNIPEHSKLLKKIVQERKQRMSRQRMQKLFKYTSIGFTAVIIITLTVAFIWVRGEQKKTESALSAEAAAKRAAEEEKDKAVFAREAEANQRKIAEGEKRKAQKENYINSIALAERKIEEKYFGEAHALLAKTLEELRNWEWGRLAFLCDLARLTLKGHSGAVSCVAVSWDGTRIVTGSYDGTAKVWNAGRGTEILTLKGHGSEVFSVSYSPDGMRIVTGSGDGTAKIWDTVSGKEVLTLKGHMRRVSSAEFSPSGKHIVTGSKDGTAKLWDAGTGIEVLTLDAHLSVVNSASFSPDGLRIVTGSKDRTARVWNVLTGEELFILNGHADDVYSASFSPDGMRIVTGSKDGTAKVWDAVAGTEVLTLKGHTGEVYSASFSHDGTKIITGSRDGTAKGWDAETGAEILMLSGHLDAVYSAVFSLDGTMIVTASRDGTAKVWDAAADTEVLTLKGRTGEVYSVSFSCDGKKIVTGSWEGTAKVWDADTCMEVLSLKGLVNYSAAFSPDGTRIVTGSWEGMARVWDAVTGKEVLTLKGHTGEVYSAVFSPDGTMIVTVSGDGTARVWDAETGKEVHTLKGHTRKVSSAAFSHDGRRIVTGSRDGTARVWDAVTGAEVLTLKGHAGEVYSASFSPDDKMIITGSKDRTAKVWDADTGQKVLTLKGHAGDVYSALFSPDGTRIVTGSKDGTAKVWDAVTGAEVLTLKGHAGEVYSASFSPDGTRIVTGSDDKTVKIWPALDWTKTPEEREKEKLKKWRARFRI